MRTLIDKAENELAGGALVKTSDVETWNSLARDYLTRAFGSGSPHIRTVLNGSGSLWINMTPEDINQHYRESFRDKIKKIEVCIEVLETDIALSNENNQSDLVSVESPKRITSNPTKVFLVHGHNDGIKQTVARLLETLGLEVIILHEKPNSGRTIIQKFTDYSEAHFAVVLATADDVGKARADPDLKARARQNVILELGYFLGKLSASHVCTLFEHGVEMPSDYQGVLFVPLDGGGLWKYSLARELQAAGFKVDLNKVN